MNYWRYSIISQPEKENKEKYREKITGVNADSDIAKRGSVANVGNSRWPARLTNLQEMSLNRQTSAFMRSTLSVPVSLAL